MEGQRYYIEALHKEGVWIRPHAVGWQLTFEQPIPGSRLSPFGSQPMATFDSETTIMQMQSTDTDGEQLLTEEASEMSFEIYRISARRHRGPDDLWLWRRG